MRYDIAIVGSGPAGLSAGYISSKLYQYIKASGEGLVAGLSAVSYLDKK